MPVILLSADIACSSHVSGAAASRSVACETAMNTGRLLERVAAQPFNLVILDLTLPGLDCGELVPQLRSAPFPPKAVAAFGPHVHERQLLAATQAGCDAVLARGQFYASAADLIERFCRDSDAAQPT